MTNAHEELIVSAMKAARIEAVTFHRRLSKALGINRDECVSVAYEALVVAAPKFDPRRGYQFWSFAKRRVLGALMDQVRAVQGRAAEPRQFISVDGSPSVLDPLPSHENAVIARVVLNRKIRGMEGRQLEVFTVLINGGRPADAMELLSMSPGMYSWTRGQALIRMRRVCGVTK